MVAQPESEITNANTTKEYVPFITTSFFTPTCEMKTLYDPNNLVSIAAGNRSATSYATVSIDWSELFLSKNRKAVYWTKVQYGGRSRHKENPIRNSKSET